MKRIKLFEEFIQLNEAFKVGDNVTVTLNYSVTLNYIE